MPGVVLQMGGGKANLGKGLVEEADMLIDDVDDDEMGRRGTLESQALVVVSIQLDKKSQN